MIVVATEDFELYHGLVGDLRDRGLTFTTLEPGEPLPAETSVVLAGEDDDPAPDGDDPAPGDDGLADVEVVRADPGDPRGAVDEALALLRGGDGRTVVGVDPGVRPGIAVLDGDVVVAVFQVPLEDAAAVIRREASDDGQEAAAAGDTIVRIGDGARLEGSRLVNELDDLRVELVDETGTTPYLGEGVRESGDVVAAINIARMEGEVVDSREVDPTEGELQVIKNRSREASPENRTITEALARRVATGELTVEEALAEHRDGGE